MTNLSPGDPAPPFVLQDQESNQVGLADYRGRKLLIYFYPKANTPGCTKQACAVRDCLQDLAQAGVTALGISPDQPQAQRRFDAKFTLGFPLLSDPDHVTAEAYGAWGDKSMYGKTHEGIIRSAFLVDEQGSIMRAWYKVSPGDTVPNVQRELAG